MAYQFNADAGLVRSAWPRRHDDPLRPHRFDFFNSDLIVAANLDLCSQFSDVLNQVVGKRIVIVEDENQLKYSCEKLTPASGAVMSGEWLESSDRNTVSSVH